MSKQEISDKQLQNWIDFTKPMTAKNWGGDIAEHLHSALTELQARREAERWIPVSEKLLNGVPNEAGYAECRVQVWQTFFENPQIAKFVLFKDGDWGCTLPSLSGNAKEYVNHWRPLPIPPEVK